MTTRSFGVLLVLFVTGCEDPPESPPYYPPTNVCTAAQEGEVRCAGTWVQTCQALAWSSTTNCADTGQTCEYGPGPPPAAQCAQDTGCNEAGAYRCNNAVVETCNGYTWDTVQDCGLLGQQCQEDPGPPATAACMSEKCDLLEIGANKCDGTKLMECQCDGGNICTFQLKKDCATESKICQEHPTLDDVADCVEDVPLKQEGEQCTGTGQGNCDSGLTCIPMGNESYCGIPCDPQGTGAECGTGKYCMALSGSSGICEAQVDHGDMCFEVYSEEACSAAGDYCAAMLSQDIGACTTDCLATNINSIGTCTGGDYCVRTNFYVVATPCATAADCDQTQGYACEDFTEYELGNLCSKGTVGQPDFDLQDTACTVETADADCQTTNGWECVSFQSGTMCALNSPVCATLTPFWDGTQETDPDTGNDYIPDQFICGQGAQMCGIIGDSNANPPAQAFCSNDIFEYDFIGLCVAFCEDDENNPLDCGTQATCAQPTPDDEYVMHWKLQDGGGIACTEGTAGVDCHDDFPTCVNFTTGGWQCARPMKVCQPN
ncbi:hypothetical protein ACFL6C_13710 [Myxococcota bacterium]